MDGFYNLSSMRQEALLSEAKWCLEAESNHRHGDFQSPALPTELSRHIRYVRCTRCTRREEMVPTAGIELATY